MKVYLDDLRDTPEGWVRVYWPDEAIALLKTGNVTEISLDHDLGDDERGTGYHVVTWIEEQVFASREEIPFPGFVVPIITVHSANSSARAKMLAGIESIYKKAYLKIMGEQGVNCVYAMAKTGDMWYRISDGGRPWAPVAR